MGPDSSGRPRPALPEAKEGLQLKPTALKNILEKFSSIMLLSSVIVSTSSVFSQGYDDTFEMKNKIKVELQYADYFEYEYPEPIIFWYGKQEYAQNYPYIVNFPERRGLIKFTRLAGPKTAISVKYQFSDLREDVNQHLGEAKITRNFGESVIGLVGAQIINDTRGFNAYQPGIGIQWNISPLTIIQADAQYYTRGTDSEPVGGKLGSLNIRLKYRQVLTISTALFLEYIFYDASGETIDFKSHTASVWLSQFLPTQTAVHLNLRFYDNSMGIRSIAPSLEIARYLNWKTILRLKYRYYANESENISLGEADVIIPDNLKSHAISAQLNRDITPDLLVYMKYRYYKSNLHVEMNTYLLGFVYSF